MNNLECLRDKLYKTLESGDTEDIIKASQELDTIILFYIKNQLGLSKKSA